MSTPSKGISTFNEYCSHKPEMGNEGPYIVSGCPANFWPLLLNET